MNPRAQHVGLEDFPDDAVLARADGGRLGGGFVEDGVGDVRSMDKANRLIGAHEQVADMEVEANDVEARPHRLHILNECIDRCMSPALDLGGWGQGLDDEFGGLALELDVIEVKARIHERAPDKHPAVDLALLRGIRLWGTQPPSRAIPVLEDPQHLAHKPALQHVWMLAQLRRHDGLFPRGGEVGEVRSVDLRARRMVGGGG